MRNGDGLNQAESSGEGKKCWDSGYIFKLQPRLAEKNTRVKNYSKAFGRDNWKDDVAINEMGNSVTGERLAGGRGGFSFKHLRFQMTIRHESGDVKDLLDT